MMVHTSDVDMVGLGQCFRIYFPPYPTDKQSVYTFLFVVLQQPKPGLGRHDVEIPRLNIIMYIYVYVYIHTHTHIHGSTPLIE
jgi:hypothetical protein